MLTLTYIVIYWIPWQSLYGGLKVKYYFGVLYLWVSRTSYVYAIDL